LNRIGFEVPFYCSIRCTCSASTLTQASSRPSKGAAFWHETPVLASSKTAVFNLRATSPRISGLTAADVRLAGEFGAAIAVTAQASPHFLLASGV
jgi:hypothetical protein